LPQIFIHQNYFMLKIFVHKNLWIISTRVLSYLITFLAAYHSKFLGWPSHPASQLLERVTLSGYKRDHNQLLVGQDRTSAVHRLWFALPPVINVAPNQYVTFARLRRHVDQWKVGFTALQPLLFLIIYGSVITYKFFTCKSDS